MVVLQWPPCKRSGQKRGIVLGSIDTQEMGTNGVILLAALLLNITMAKINTAD
ncbi:MAG: hypothetical protein GWP08_14730 [Nitrospiraceae bacterium]|nr:hypothetical protein [Nitrospiraceae bacterium]